MTMNKKLLLSLFLVFGMIFFVSCGDNGRTGTIAVTTETETTEEKTTESLIVLPDLTGKTIDDVKALLDALQVSYTIQYETNKNVDDNLFVEYVGDYEAGSEINSNDEVIVKLNSHDIYLPDLANMGQSDIINYFISIGVNNFSFSVINDNDVADQTFAGYENHEVGDKVDASEIFVVYIAFNDVKVPDLSGLIKRQIAEELASLDINYTFSYVENDEFPEDTFAYYNNVEIGDFYDNDELVVDVVLYKNTFTDAETSVIISKYLDYEDNSAIELYNATDHDVDLSDYRIDIYSGGSYDVTYSFALGNKTLAAGDTFLIASTATEPNIQKYADLRTAQLEFDGVNDTIQLVYKNGTYIDTIYQIGDRGSDMNDEIFVRRDGIVSGSRIFNLGEWTTFVPEYYDVLLNEEHPIVNDEMLTYSVQEIATLVTNGFDSPYGGMDLVEYRGAADGDTAYFYPGYLEGERVRFIGNDTPETSPAVVDEPEPWGLEAKAYTKTILEYADDNGKNIYIQSDPDVGYTEGYGRHLGIIWVDLGQSELSIDIKDSQGNVLFTEKLSGVICVNYLLVKNGFSADEYSSKSTLQINHRYMHRWFDEAERFAKENHLGIHEE